MKMSFNIRQEAERYSLFIALLLVLLTAALDYRAWDTLERTRREALITRGIMDGTTALLSSLKDAESGQRGFLLTGSDHYLDPYRRAVADIPASLAAVSRLESNRGNPLQVQRLRRLRPLVRNKLDELAQTIELRRTQGMDAALAIVRSDRGQAAMDEIRALCDQIHASSDDILSQQREQVRVSAYEAGLTSIVGSSAVFVLLVLATVTIRKGTRQRQRLIQDLQHNEEQARAARDLLQTTIASIGDAVITTSTSGTVVFLNPVAQSLTGWKQEDALGKPLAEVFKLCDEETGAPVDSPVGTALRQGTVASLAHRTRLLARDGRQIPIDDSAAPIRTAQGAITGAVLVFRDVTRQREAELAEKTASAELARRSELLERTNAELQQFAYAASHDLREPLRTITAYTQLVQLRAGSQLDARNLECLQFIVSAADRMGLLIDALLDYSKAGELANRQLAPLETEDALGIALANLNGSIDGNHALVTHDPLPQLVGDKTQIAQLFQNLIGNALKYRRAEIPQIHVTARNSGNQWLFSVSDNGQGIPPAYQTQVFELFRRLHGHQYPGTGIGLATCKRLVERYGGRIWVESEVDKGSTFYFTLPAE